MDSLALNPKSEVKLSGKAGTLGRDEMFSPRAGMMSLAAPVGDQLETALTQAPEFAYSSEGWSWVETNDRAPSVFISRDGDLWTISAMAVPPFERCVALLSSLTGKPLEVAVRRASLV